MKIKLGLGGLPNPLKEIAKQATAAAKSLSDGAAKATKGAAGVAAAGGAELRNAADVARAASHMLLGTPAHTTPQVDDPNRFDAADVYAFQRRAALATQAVTFATIAGTQFHAVQAGQMGARFGILTAGAVGATAAGVSAQMRGEDGMKAFGQGMTDAAQRRAAFDLANTRATGHLAADFATKCRDAMAAVLEVFSPDVDGEKALAATDQAAAHAFEDLEASVEQARLGQRRKA